MVLKYRWLLKFATYSCLGDFCFGHTQQVHSLTEPARTCIRLCFSRNNIHHGCFTGTIRAQQAKHLPVGDLEGVPYIKMCENLPYAFVGEQELDYTIRNVASTADSLEQFLEPGKDIA